MGQMGRPPPEVPLLQQAQLECWGQLHPTLFASIHLGREGEGGGVCWTILQGGVVEGRKHKQLLCGDMAKRAGERHNAGTVG